MTIQVLGALMPGIVERRPCQAGRSTENGTSEGRKLARRAAKQLRCHSGKPRSPKGWRPSLDSPCPVTLRSRIPLQGWSTAGMSTPTPVMRWVRSQRHRCSGTSPVGWCWWNQKYARGIGCRKGSGERTPPAFTTCSTRLRRPAAAERHSSSARRVRRLNGSSHQYRRFGAGSPFHSRNRRRRVASLSYTLERA